MDYMILLHSDENQGSDAAPGTPEFDAFMAEWTNYSQLLMDGGHYISGAGLAPTATATTLVKNPDGTESITDGPYAETKEQLGGFYLIQATDLDEALVLARKVPIPVGSFEVRPVMARPDA